MSAKKWINVYLSICLFLHQSYLKAHSVSNKLDKKCKKSNLIIEKNKKCRKCPALYQAHLVLHLLTPLLGWSGAGSMPPPGGPATTSSPWASTWTTWPRASSCPSCTTGGSGPWRPTTRWPRGTSGWSGGRLAGFECVSSVVSLPRSFKVHAINIV